MDEWLLQLYNNLFVLGIILFWAALFAYVVVQKIYIKKKSQSLEVEAEMGRSSSKLFHDISGHIGTMSAYIYFLDNAMKDGEIDIDKMAKLRELSKFLIDYTKNMKHMVSDVYRSGDDKVELVDTLKRVVDTQVRACYRKTNIEVNEEYPDHPVYVSARIFEALFNVIRNACEALEEAKERRISVKMLEKGPNVYVFIEDSGPGMPKHVAARAFKYGFTTKEKGTGQGMTIAKESVEKSGGEIAFESEEGKGSIFTISLPILEKPKDKAADEDA